MESRIRFAHFHRRNKTGPQTSLALTMAFTVENDKVWVAIAEVSKKDNGMKRRGRELATERLQLRRAAAIGRNTFCFDGAHGAGIMQQVRELEATNRLKQTRDLLNGLMVVAQ